VANRPKKTKALLPAGRAAFADEANVSGGTARFCLGDAAGFLQNKANLFADEEKALRHEPAPN